jgi:hypothetical protein
MKQQIVFIFLLCLLSAARAHDAAAAIDLTVNHYGLTLGNAGSPGERLNGLNLTLGAPVGSPYDQINGLTLGLFTTAPAGRINGAAIGTVYVPSNETNGLVFSGFMMDYAADITGIALAGLWLNGSDLKPTTIKGVGFGGYLAKVPHFEGMLVSGLAAMAKEATGIMIGGGYSRLIRLKGAALGGLITLVHGEAHGVMIGGIGTSAAKMTGLAVGGLINETGELHGVQIGLVNCADNNPKYFKCLPLINMNLSASSDHETE